jgi:hypothetical protein
LIILFLPFITLQQVVPQWLSTPYMEARSITAINNNQKLTGTYSYNVGFFKNLQTPQIALGKSSNI